MEKFGIFELLDTLSALASPEKEEKPTQAQPENETAFAPPAYGNEQNVPPSAPPHAVNNADALAGFLARHEALSKKIDKKQ